MASHSIEERKNEREEREAKRIPSFDTSCAGGTPPPHMGRKGFSTEMFRSVLLTAVLTGEGSNGETPEKDGLRKEKKARTRSCCLNDQDATHADRLPDRHREMDLIDTWEDTSTEVDR